MRLIFMCVWCILFCLNVQAGNNNFTGFMFVDSQNKNNLIPISQKYKSETPKINLENGNDLTIIIYSHGTDRPHKRENCTKSYNQIPQSLKILKKADDTYFYYLCSKATDGSEAGSFIYKRIKEIDNVLDQLISKGVRPENIFLAGYSAGGWASLMMMDRVENKFNSAIVFAPTFSGSRSEINQYPVWRKEARPRQIKQMTKAKIVKALIFAYEDDAFNRPQELIFLKKKYPSSVKLVGYTCNQGHGTMHNDCKITKTKKIIKNYIENSR